MEVNLEQLDKITIILPGLYQFTPNGLFESAALALTTEDVVIYNDQRPDSITDVKAFYNIKEQYAFGDIQHVRVESIKHEGELAGMKRLNVILTEMGKSFIFYYRRKDEKIAEKMTKELKRRKINVTTKSVDMRSKL